MVHPRVLRAMTTPLLGHLDPLFLDVMNDVQAQLRDVFRTSNAFTIAVSGTGSAGMEAALITLVEPGDAVIVGINGVFGGRMANIVERCGGKPIPLAVTWGGVFDLQQLEDALRREGRVKAVALVHAETSTGAHQPIEGIGALCHQYGALLRSRYGHIFGGGSGISGRLGDRRLLQRHSKVPQLPSGTLTADCEPPCLGCP